MVLSVSFVISPSRPVLFTGRATSGTILGYVFYWIAVMVTLFVLKRRGTLSILESLDSGCHDVSAESKARTQA